mgnify:CR=1 FL=1
MLDSDPLGHLPHHLQEERLQCFAVELYFTNDLIFNTLMGIMHIRANDFYEPENDISSSAYDTNASRFMTLYGKRKIIEHE